MIAIGYKKLAEELNFKIQKGVAYGEIGGFLSTFNEGAGYKTIVVSFYAANDQIRESIGLIFNDDTVTKQYRLTDVALTDKYLSLSFHDDPGTMKCIRAFIDWFFPLLGQTGASGATICPECGQMMQQSDRSYRMIDKTVFAFHRGCAESIKRDMVGDEQDEKNEKANLGRGAVGALLGGLVAAIPWAILYAMGWIAGICGYLIGLAAKKGYALFGGRLKKATIPVFIVVILVSIVFAQALGTFFEFGYYMISGEFENLAWSDMPMVISELVQDGDFIRSFLCDVAVGILFAGLSVFGMFKEIVQGVSSKSKKFEELN